MVDKREENKKHPSKSQKHEFMNQEKINKKMWLGHNQLNRFIILRKKNGVTYFQIHSDIISQEAI